MSNENEVQPSDDVGLLDSASTDSGEAVSEKPIDHRADQTDQPVDRPEYWPENFWNKDKSEPDMEGIAKSWMDLRKMVSQGKHKAPVDGAYDSKAFGSIPESDPVRQHVSEWAKEYNISQAAFDALVGRVVEMGGEHEEQSAYSLESERRSLGQNADAIIKGMSEWANGLVSKGVWGKGDFDEFKIMGGTAQGLKTLMKLRESYEGMRIPTMSAPSDGAPSKDELYQMVGDPRYQTDAAYRKKVEKAFSQAFV